MSVSDNYLRNRTRGLRQGEAANQAVIEDLLNKVSALHEAVAVWRPIETAPHDAVVLIFLSCPGIDVIDDIVIARWEDDEDFPDGGAWYPACADGGMPIDVPATHWMPMPAPPIGSNCVRQPDKHGNDHAYPVVTHRS